MAKCSTVRLVWEPNENPTRTYVMNRLNDEVTAKRLVDHRFARPHRGRRARSSVACCHRGDECRRRLGGCRGGWLMARSSWRHGMLAVMPWSAGVQGTWRLADDGHQHRLHDGSRGHQRPGPARRTARRRSRWSKMPAWISSYWTRRLSMVDTQSSMGSPGRGPVAATPGR